MNWKQAFRKVLEVFGHPSRKRRRGPCGCSHKWSAHFAAGCTAADCSCRLNRRGLPSKATAVKVKMVKVLP